MAGVCQFEFIGLTTLSFPPPPRVPPPPPFCPDASVNLSRLHNMRSHLKQFRDTLICERGFRRGGNSANGETTTGFTSRHPTPPPNAARLFGSASCKTSNRAGDACGGDSDQRGLSADGAHATGHREDPDPLETAGMCKPSGPAPFRKASPSGSSLSTRDGSDGLHLPYGMGIWLHRLDSGPSCRTPGPEDTHPPVGALDYAALEEGRLLLRHASPHAQGKASREGAPQGQETPPKVKKGLSGPILVFASALETKAASTSIPI